MKQQPDNIFREKLSQYGKPAPAMAWDRIEKNLDAKTKAFPWRKIAASLLLLAIATPALIFLLTQDVDNHVAEVPLDTNEVPKIARSQEKNPQPAERNVGSADNDRMTQPAQSQHQILKEIEPSSTEEVELASIDSRSVDVSLTLDTVSDKPETGEAIAVADVEISIETLLPEATQPTVTLVISAEETTSYYEGEKIIDESEATTKDKKPSTFKKLLRKASDLKTNQDPFGELRQKKNEILALNFKNEKKRSQKNN
jgi:hypothetical protein